MNYKTLVLSGGSVKGVGFLGGLKYLSEHSDLNELVNFYGTSIGSIVCIFIALGMTTDELLAHFFTFEFSISPTLTKEDIEVVNYKKFLKKVQEMLVEKTGSVPTLLDVETVYGKSLYIIAYNYTKSRPEVLSARTHPDMSCLDAIRLSCALPFIFGRNMYEGDLYFDGGLVCNFPLNLAVQNRSKNIVAFNLKSCIEHSSSDAHLTLFLNLLFAPIEHQTSEIVNKYKSKCAYVEMSLAIPLTRFKLSIVESISLYLQGYYTSKEFLERKNFT